MNTTTNGLSSWSCSSVKHSAAAKIGQTIAFSLIFVVSLVGNSLVGIIVYRTPNLRKPINFLIANMALSDLLFPIFSMSKRLSDLHSDSWLIGGPLGQILCKLPAFLADVSSMVSVQSLVLISVDRLGAVVVPLRSPLISCKLCPFFILATWIVAIAVASPNLFSYKLVENQEEVKCQNQWAKTFGEKSFVTYLLAGVSVFFYIPMILLVAVYSIILIKLKKHVHPGEQSVNAEEQRTKRNRNVLKMAIAIVLAFFLCWLPAYTILLIIQFLEPTSSIRSSCSFRAFSIFTYFLAFANCAINPTILFISSSNYRKGLKRLVN